MQNDLHQRGRINNAGVCLGAEDVRITFPIDETVWGVGTRRERPGCRGSGGSIRSHQDDRTADRLPPFLARHVPRRQGLLLGRRGAEPVFRHTGRSAGTPRGVGRRRVRSFQPSRCSLHHAGNGQGWPSRQVGAQLFSRRTHVVHTRTAQVGAVRAPTTENHSPNLLYF